jgi:hypothetical protein
MHGSSKFWMLENFHTTSDCRSSVKLKVLDRAIGRLYHIILSKHWYSLVSQQYISMKPLSTKYKSVF